MPTCYRHPDRETGLSCAHCDRPICTDCMVHAAVGVRCPECAGGTRVRRPAFAMSGAAPLTTLLIMVNVGVFLATSRLGGAGGLGGGQLNALGYDLALYGPAVAAGEWYRLVTNGFVHFGLLHLGFNMYALYLLGGALERYAGTLRFGMIYLVSLLCGSFGALLLSPDAATAGASGAVYGLMGALFVLERQRGIALLGGPIGGLLVINLLFTFAFAGQISVGGHLGGLIGGAMAGLVLSRFGRGHLAHSPVGALPLAGLVLIASAAVAGSLAVSGAIA